MAKVATYEIAPDPTLMEDIGATSFSVAEAIAELIANSLDARPGDDRLAIAVQVSDGQISVTDNGRGMSADVLAEAVRLGVKMDQIVGNAAPRKGMFGLGLKTAAASLGRVWELHTREVPTHGVPPEEHSVVFDLTEWRRRSGDKTFQWAIEVKSDVIDLAGPLGNRVHGTAVVIHQLRERSPMAGPVLQKLGQAYKPNLEGGDQITVNGEAVVPPAFEYVPDSKLDIAEDLSGGRKITGWVALDKKTHNDDYFGLNLYRQGQLIEPWNKAWFRAHLMTSRIIGEIHLDFVPTNYFKRGFETQSVEWKLASERMREVLRPVARASQAMARNRNDPLRAAKAVEGLKRATGKAGSIDLGDEGAPDTSKTSKDPREVPFEVSPDTLILPGDTVHLVCSVADLSSDVIPWGYVFDEAAHELQAVLNSGSRLYAEVKDQTFLGTLALADCVTAFLVDRKGFSSKQAREIRDRWIYVSMGKS